MPRRALTAFVLGLAAVASFAGSTPEAPPVPPVIQAAEAETKKRVDELEKIVAFKDDALFAKTLREFETLRSDQFVRFIRIGLKSMDAGVAAAALRAAATHEMKDVEKDVRKLLRAKIAKRTAKDLVDPTMDGEVGAAAIDYLVRLDFAGEEATVVDGWLDPLVFPAATNESRVKAAWAKDLLRACIHDLGKFKFKRSVPLLITLVADPAPLETDTKGEKPGSLLAHSYWAPRLKLWQASEGWVRWALKEITGQTFKTAREWEAWLAQNRKDYK